MHNYTEFPVFCLMWFTVLYLVETISLAENVETRVQFLAINMSAVNRVKPAGCWWLGPAGSTGSRTVVVVVAMTVCCSLMCMLHTMLAATSTSKL